jgi:hypothetical protein
MFRYRGTVIGARLFIEKDMANQEKEENYAGSNEKNSPH